MFTSITKELLGTKIAECNKIIYQTLTIDDEYALKQQYKRS